MNSPILPQLADRLAKLLGMLGSDHAGERASAGAKADKAIRAAGLTWRDVIIGSAHNQEMPNYSEIHGWHWRIRAEWALEQDDFLTDWEIGFLTSLLDQNRLTRRQYACLAGISNKILA